MGFGLVTYRRYAGIILAGHAGAKAVIVFIKHPGAVTRVSIYKTRKVMPRHIRSSKYYLLLRGSK